MSPKSSSSFLRQQKEFAADLLREMVNFLPLSAVCQCLSLIYVSQLKMETSIPKAEMGGQEGGRRGGGRREEYSMRKGFNCEIYLQMQ